MLQQVSIFDNLVSFLGIGLTKEKIPQDMRKYICRNVKMAVPCFLIRRESIVIKSMKDVIVKGISQDAIQMTSSQFAEVLTIVSRNGSGYVFITFPETTQRRSSDTTIISRSKVMGIFNYFCRIEDDDVEEQDDDNEVWDDDDFEMMFSSKTTPFVGSFVESFVDSIPIIA